MGVGGVLTKGILICYNTSMNNKTLKNLIAIGIFAFFVMGVNNVNASDIGKRPYTPRYVNPAYVTPIYNTDAYSYGETQYNYAQQEPYTYVQAQPQIKYIEQPVRTEIRYIPATSTTTSTNNTYSNQGASVVRANTSTNQTRTYTSTNTGSRGNTGEYVSYDANGQMISASAYNGYNNGQQVVYDDNGVTALSVRGSGGFMPSSVWQWLLLIILILAIVIVARMVSKTFSNNSHGVPAH